VKLTHVIEELIQERGLERAVLSEIIREGIFAAYTKKYPEYHIIVDYNKKNDELEIKAQKEVVKVVENEALQISLRKARAYKEDAEEGQMLTIPFELPLGRIEILKIKQMIAQRIQEVEAAAVYKEFKPRENTIVQGVMHKTERNGITIMLHDTMAFLPRSLMIPEDRPAVGYPVRALLKEVLEVPRQGYQLILDRISPEFLHQLFELEIPEVFEKLVEVKKVVRVPGYKAKVLVASHDADIDPVGTCVGVGGARIKPILKELSNEKIDVIPYSDFMEELVKNALKPAEINRVGMVDAATAQVWLDEDQRSLAIGKGGQNIMLASQLTGVHINLVKNEVVEGPIYQEIDREVEDESL
jgi:transcription termination/antitermination protein NusA